MPNWCENYVDICGPIEAMNHFIDTYCERDPNMPSEVRICFGKIIPIEHRNSRGRWIRLGDHQSMSLPASVRCSPATPN